MTSAGDRRGLTGLYEGLARYQQWRRRLSGARPGEGLEMHKRLLAPPADGPGAGVSALHGWLWERLQPPTAARVLDVGCGLGASVLAWARTARGASFVGLGLGAYPLRVAAREAERLGVGERCSFRAQGYDEPLAGEFDVVVSIESLFHAPDLEATLRRLSGHLAADGRLALVEDMAADRGVVERADARALLADWSTTRLHAVDDYREALQRAGLRPIEEVDLSPQVPRRSPASLEARRARLAALRRAVPVPSVRRVIDAFLGGLALERLHHAGSMRYLAMFAGRAEAGA